MPPNRRLWRTYYNSGRLRMQSSRSWLCQLLRSGQNLPAPQARQILGTARGLAKQVQIPPSPPIKTPHPLWMRHFDLLRDLSPSANLRPGLLAALILKNPLPSPFLRRFLREPSVFFRAAQKSLGSPLQFSLGFYIIMTNGIGRLPVFLPKPIQKSKGVFPL